MIVSSKGNNYFYDKNTMKLSEITIYRNYKNKKMDI